MKKRGFTLVELLVVIAIIGVLVALLLPAVQAAREAARRMQCGNNVKQMSLAIQNYHDTFMYTPYGARCRVKGTTTNYGPSWLFAILPYCEQKPLYDKMDGADRLGSGGDYRANVDTANPPNNPATHANGAKIKYMLCPSTPLPETDSYGGGVFVRPSYVGVAGAYTGGGTIGTAPNTFSENRWQPSAGTGFHSGGGMLIVNEALTFAACIDGTAFCIVVGETSDWFYSGTSPNFTTRNRIDGSIGAFWFTGAGNAQKATVSGTGASTPVAYNLTTLNLASLTADVKQNDNNRTGSNNFGLPGRGIQPRTATDTNQERGGNHPILSAHPNGSMAGYLDGHVELVTRQTSQIILSRLFTRDDGGVIMN